MSGKRKDEIGRVVRRYCDTAMASKKGYLPCEKNCKGCHACIEQLDNGERRHVTGKKG